MGSWPENFDDVIVDPIAFEKEIAAMVAAGTIVILALNAGEAFAAGGRSMQCHNVMADPAAFPANIVAHCKGNVAAAPKAKAKATPATLDSSPPNYCGKGNVPVLHTMNPGHYYWGCDTAAGVPVHPAHLYKSSTPTHY